MSEFLLRDDIIIGVSFETSSGPAKTKAQKGIPKGVKYSGNLNLVYLD